MGEIALDEGTKVYKEESLENLLGKSRVLVGWKESDMVDVKQKKVRPEEERRWSSSQCPAPSRVYSACAVAIV